MKRTFVVALASLMVPAVLAARTPTVPRTPEEILAGKKAITEERKARAEEAMAQVASCCEHPRVPALETACRERLPRIRSDMGAALWAYQCGNYDEAIRIYAVANVAARDLGRLCALGRASEERCSRSITNAIQTLRKWGEKATRLKDPLCKQAIDAAIARSEKELTSLQASCATSDPAIVVREIGPRLHAVDLLFRKAR